MPGASKWPLEHTLGHQGPQKGAIWVAFGAQDVEFGSFGAPTVLKMGPLGTPLGRQIGILEPVGNIVQPAVDLVSCLAHVGIIFGHLGTKFGSCLTPKWTNDARTHMPRIQVEKQQVFNSNFMRRRCVRGMKMYVFLCKYTCFLNVGVSRRILECM